MTTRKNSFGYALFSCLFIITVTACSGESEPAPIATPEADVTDVVPATVAGSPTISPVSPVSPISEATNKPAKPRLTPEETQVILEQAINAQESGDYSRASELVETLLDEDPTNFLALNVRGSISLANENTQEALSDYTRAIELDPLFPHAYYNRGRVYRVQGEHEQALADLQKAVDLSPREMGYRALGNIGLIHYEQGDYEAAIEAFSESITYNSNDRADVYYYRAEAYNEMGDYQTAIEDYEAAVARFERYSDAYRGLGYARLRAGMPAEALAALERAQALAYNHPTNQLYLALVALTQNEPAQAKQLAAEAMARINTLDEAERELVLSRVTAALAQVADESPEQAEAIETIQALVTAP